MKLDPTITFAVILSICAVISPSITAVINNRHQYKMKLLELEHEDKRHRYEVLYQQKIKVYQSFVSQAPEYNWIENDKDYNRINSLLHEAMLLCNSETYPLLLKFQIYVNGNSFSPRSYNEMLADISKAFNKELTNLLA